MGQVIYAQKTLRVQLKVDRLLQKALRAERKRTDNPKLSEAKFLADLVERALSHGK